MKYCVGSELFQCCPVFRSVIKVCSNFLTFCFASLLLSIRTSSKNIIRNYSWNPPFELVCQSYRILVPAGDFFLNCLSTPGLLAYTHLYIPLDFSSELENSNLSVSRLEGFNSNNQWSVDYSSLDRLEIHITFSSTSYHLFDYQCLTRLSKCPEYSGLIWQQNFCELYKELSFQALTSMLE